VQEFKEGLPQGTHIEYFAQKEASEKQVSKMSNYDKKGNFHGDQKSYYPSGQVQAHLQYEHGLMEGKKTLYDEVGQIVEEASYRKNQLEGRFRQNLPEQREVVFHYHNNLKNGIHQVYSFHEGQKYKVLEVEYKDDQLHGLAQEYSEKGVLLLQTEYRNGVKEGLEMQYYLNGAKHLEISYINNQKNGIAKQYYPTGELYKEISFIQDRKSGLEKTYYKSGALAGQSNYVEDVLDGMMKHFNEQGHIVFEAEYIHGKRHGKMTKYFEDGSPYIEQYFVDDKLHGTKTKYDKNGEVVIQNFDHGLLID